MGDSMMDDEDMEVSCHHVIDDDDVEDKHKHDVNDNVAGDGSWRQERRQWDSQCQQQSQLQHSHHISRT